MAIGARCLRVVPLALALCGVLTAGHAYGQVFDLQPTLQTRITFSDNIRAAGSDKRSGWVAEVSPGLSGGISREGARVQGRFNMSARNIGYTSDDGWRRPALSLQAGGQVEAIEDLFFIEADAAIRRSNLSLFAGRSGDDFLNADRRNETRSFALAPRLEFALGSFADAQLRYRQSWLAGGSGALTAQRRGEWSADLTGARAFGPLGWGLNYRRADTAYRGGDLNDVREESLRGSLFYTVTPQFRVRAIAGRERNDFGDGRKQSNSITGAGFDWNPSPRTTVSGYVEDRFFGNGYDLNFSHRMARSTFQLGLGRDVTSSVQRFGSVFSDPFFQLLFNAPSFVAEFPDPAEREDVVRAILGLTGDSFVSNAYFVDQRLRAAYTLRGARNTLTLGYTQSNRSRVSGIGGLRGEDIFRESDRVKNRSLSLAYSHRLTPHSSLNASVARSIAERSGGLSDRTRRLTTTLGYNTRLGHRTVGGLTYRHQRSSGANDFTENVISANMNMRF
jgi:uncharacterized protein (PEP-CTERM system associated)